MKETIENKTKTKETKKKGYNFMVLFVLLLGVDFCDNFSANNMYKYLDIYIASYSLSNNIATSISFICTHYSIIFSSFRLSSAF